MYVLEFVLRRSRNRANDPGRMGRFGGGDDRLTLLSTSSANEYAWHLEGISSPLEA